MAPYRFRQPASVKVRIDGSVVAVAFRDRQQGVQLRVLDGTITGCAARTPCRDGVEHLLIGKWRQAVRHVGEVLHHRQGVGVLDDLKSVPQHFDHLIDLAAPIGQGQHTDHLREPGVGGGADQQPAGLAALLVRMASQPGPRTPTHSQRKAREVDRFVHAPRPAALAAYDLLDQIAARTALVEPQPPATGIVRPVDELIPVDVVDVALRAGADEPGGNNRLLVVASVGEGGARNHAPRARARTSAGAWAGTGLLHHEPLGEPPRADSSLPLLPALRLRWRGVETRVGHAGHGHQLGREARLVDRLEARLAAPGIESTHDRGVVGEVDECARPEGGDHLATSHLPMPLPVHEPPPPPNRLERSLRKRFTCGSTSRSDRLVRNFLWWWDSKSVSSISRRSGFRVDTSYF